jgi:hypothetical protein
LRKIIQKYEFLSLEIYDNCDFVLIKVKDSKGQIMSTDELKIMRKAMREDMSNESYDDELLKKKFFLGEIIGGDESYQKGAIKLSLENESLLEFIKDDVLCQIHPNHENKVLKQDEALF